MIILKNKKMIVILFVIILFAGLSHDYLYPVECKDKKKAAELFNKAKSSNDNIQKIKLFNESIKCCPSYAAYYYLGGTYMQLNRFANANEAFEKAKRLNPVEPDIYLAQGDACMELKDYGNAFLNYKYGLNLLGKSIPAYEKRLNEARIKVVQLGADAALIKKVIKRGLEVKRSIGGQKNIVVSPSIDVRVEFDFDKANLSTTGRKQADEIGKAITGLYRERTRSIGVSADNSAGETQPTEPPSQQEQNSITPPAAEFSFKLIGHTDNRGTDAYNMALSLRRARTVKFFLVSEYGIEERLISIAGEGEREPLIPNAKTEAEHSVNRRVEIVVTGE
jgi:outer membrane protein OmpA-like peptidoglycan-associated protein